MWVLLFPQRGKLRPRGIKCLPKVTELVSEDPGIKPQVSDSRLCGFELPSFQHQSPSRTWFPVLLSHNNSDNNI